MTGETAAEIRTLLALAEERGLRRAAEWVRGRMPGVQAEPTRARDGLPAPIGRQAGRRDMPAPEPWHRTVPPWEDPPCD